MNQTATLIYQELLSLGVPPKTAIGAVGSLMGESGKGLNASAVNPRDGRNGGDSIGMGQWNEERAAALRNTAAGLGTNWQDPNAQRLHIRNELTGTHRHVLERLKQADDIAHGNNVWTRNYEVPANVDKEVEKRLGNGAAFASYLASNPVATSTESAPTGVGALPQGGGLLGFGLNGPVSSAPAADVPVLPQPTEQGLLSFAPTAAGYDSTLVPQEEIMGSQAMVPPYAEWANSAGAQAQAQAAQTAQAAAGKKDEKMNWGGLLARGLEAANKAALAYAAGAPKAPAPPGASGSVARPQVGELPYQYRQKAGPVIGRHGLLG